MVTQTPPGSPSPSPPLSTAPATLPSASPTPPGPRETLLSPRGDYIARAYHDYRDCLDYMCLHETLEVLTPAGVLLASTSHMRRIPGDPHPYLVMGPWQPDDAAIYFYDVWGFDGFITLWNGFDLQGMSVPEGYVSHLVDGLMSFAFSPDFGYLAYSREGDTPRRLVIRTLEDGSEQTIPLLLSGDGYTQVGRFSWAPGSDGFIFLTRVDTAFDFNYVPLKGMRYNRLLSCSVDGADACSLEGTWLDSRTFRVQTVAGISDFDVRTGELVALATRTPKP